eukprot:4429469-Karenia_brevis.AAC.1
MAYQNRMKQDVEIDVKYVCTCPKKKQNVPCLVATNPLVLKERPDAWNPLYPLHLALQMARQCLGGLGCSRCQDRKWI